MAEASIRIGLGMNGDRIPLRDVIRLGIEAESTGFDSVWHAENQRDPAPFALTPFRKDRAASERASAGTH